MPDACYALLAATTSQNKPQIMEALAINGTIQAVNELYVCVTTETQPIKLVTAIVLHKLHACANSFFPSH